MENLFFIVAIAANSPAALNPRQVLKKAHLFLF
jgi:hypothetical protein